MWKCPKCNESIEDQFDSCWKCAGDVPNVAPPNRLFWVSFIAVVLLVQSFLVLESTVKPVNLAKVSFRQSERAAAMMAYAKDKSPENWQAFQTELSLASRHVDREQFTRAGVVFAVILSVEAVVIYFGGKHYDKPKTVA
jgi:hypothetical protein